MREIYRGTLNENSDSPISDKASRESSRFSSFRVK